MGLPNQKKALGVYLEDLPSQKRRGENTLDINSHL
jgi:hypothetical protein